ncbi:cadherin domain-containing protein [Thiofilum flexile]|uniref:cadherin domain-containing protein n=1 Tax=Thiofilum flexile TaxID=125627 RepID=UPI001FDF2E7C|nr:cadherin domain-containing protein [Thiofilum flexile]
MDLSTTANPAPWTGTPITSTVTKVNAGQNVKACSAYNFGKVNATILGFGTADQVSPGGTGYQYLMDFNQPVHGLNFKLSALVKTGLINGIYGYGESVKLVINLSSGGTYTLQAANVSNMTGLSRSGNNFAATTMTNGSVDISLPTTVSVSSIRFEMYDTELSSANWFCGSAASNGMWFTGTNACTNTTVQIDKSDAPITGVSANGTGTNSYGETLHQIVPGILLGAAIDDDTASLASIGATGDGSDDDGIVFPVLKQGQTATITATVAGAGGFLQGWIDWNGNGVWEASEQVAVNIQDNATGDTNAATGVISFNVNVPTNAVTTQTYARFRWSTTTDLNSVSNASNGEVEDYAVTVLIGNRAPVITSNGGGDTAAISVPENQTAVTTVTATDADGDTLTYSITGGADAAKFTINSSTGVLQFVSAPDYEAPTDAGANNVYDVQVTVSDGKGGTDMQAIAVTVTNLPELPVIGGTPSCTATGGTDVIFLLDNSGSVLAAEYTEYAATVVSIGNALRTANPATRIAVAHFAGPVAGGSVLLANYGQYLSLERDFSTAALSSPVRQFPSIYNYTEDNLAGAVNQLSYALDGNASTTSSFILSPLKELSRDLSRPLQIVIFTDAYRDGSVAGSSMIDGVGYGYEPNDGSNFTIYNLLKAQGVKFSMVSLTLPNGSTADERDGAAAAIASVGGSWSGIIESNPSDPDGSKTSPRRYETSSTFTLSAAQISNFVTPIANVCPIAPANRAPVITSNGGGNTASITLAEGTQTVTTVTATDADNDVLTYSISGGVDAARFSIQASTGVLTFITPPDFEAPTDSDGNNSYLVTVSVSDGKGGVDTQVLTITVTNTPEGVSLSVMGLLQGPYDSVSTLMNDSLRVLNLIPTTQPYSRYTAFNYTGNEVVSSTRLAVTGASAIVDWVIIELRDATNPSTIVAQKAGLLTREGLVLNPSNDSAQWLISAVNDGSYYVVLRHRNHLAVMTKAPIAMSLTLNSVVDFRLSSTPTYGAQAQLMAGSKAVMWAGNANLDKNIIVNGPNNDVSPVLSNVLLAEGNTLFNANYVYQAYSNSDINMDGVTIFAGPGNELNIATGNIILHPTNTTLSGNYVILGTVP